MLKLWSNLIKGTEISNTVSNANTAIGVTQNNNDDCDSNADDEYTALEPVLTFTESTTGPHTIAELAARLSQNPSPLNITNLISEVMPLNTKQKRTVSMVFYHMIRHQGKLAVEKNDQFLLYVASEGGTGKSWVIEAVRLGMKLLEREQEVLVIAPTGNAA